MSSQLTLPPHVQTILVTGAGGFVGYKVTQLLLESFPQVSLITTDIRTPPNFGITDEDRLRPVAANLGDKEEVAKLLGFGRVQGVFALHGIMSGQSEADFTLGYAVNLHSHLNVITALAEHAKSRPEGEPLPVYVNISSLAVYGGPKALPTAKVIPEDTPLIPETSYGVCKSVIELVTYDYTRKGFLDGRTCRLPTVCIRSGAPSSAASSFISGLIREPLQGLPSTCPVADSPADEIIDGMPVYVTSVKTVVWNIVKTLGVKAEDIVAAVGKTRTINLPGISITTRQILEALKEVGGEQAYSLVSFKKDPAVVAICQTWGGDFDNTGPSKLGYKRDDVKTGYLDSVRDFVEEVQANKA